MQGRARERAVQEGLVLSLPPLILSYYLSLSLFLPLSLPLSHTYSLPLFCSLTCACSSPPPPPGGAGAALRCTPEPVLARPRSGTGAGAAVRADTKRQALSLVNRTPTSHPLRPLCPQETTHLRAQLPSARVNVPACHHHSWFPSLASVWCSSHANAPIPSPCEPKHASRKQREHSETTCAHTSPPCPNPRQASCAYQPQV